MRELAQISPFLPRGAMIVLSAELHRHISQGASRPGFTFLVSIAIALWSASGGFKALVHGLNIACEVEETRGFVRLSAIALMFTAAAVIFCVIAMALAGILPLLARHLPFHSMLRAALTIASWPLAFGFGLLLLAAIYTYGPNRRTPWRWFTWGAALASALWLMGTLVFKWYVQNFGNFDRVYGNLGAMVGFLTWIWLTNVIILFGAELNHQLERLRT